MEGRAARSAAVHRADALRYKVRPRARRLIALAAIALALAPGTWLRTPVEAGPLGARDGATDNAITLTPLAIDDPSAQAQAMPITGAWELGALHPFFGGFSALVDNGEDGLLAGTDRGWTLTLPLDNGTPRIAQAHFAPYSRARSGMRELSDLEALARDPASGTVWSAFEYRNVIQRDSPDGTRTHRDPPEMARWSDNSGPETMVRLADGRFVVLAEAAERGGGDGPAGTVPGLLFARDPLEDTAPLAFRFAPPAGFRPVDAAPLPDGSVLILVRRVRIALPPRFDTAILHADPRTIAPGGLWQGEVIRRFAGPDLGENFEGIAFVAESGGGSPNGSVYVVADDNLSLFQRSVLLRLSWPPATR